MKKKTAVVLIGIVLVSAVLLLLLCSRTVHKNDEHEIRLEIQLDLDEDIGLFLIESDFGGITASGGSSNADKTMLGRHDVLYWSLEKEHYETVPDASELTLRFTVVSEYCDPNYENIYPEEYLIPMEAFSFSARFGESYSIRIIGGKTQGYHAVTES
ncbi:MAG: hypothetical protein MJ175_03005 [Clostridia bacterium]|nr:hypothetical protein [Clostridia bacterium]